MAKRRNDETVYFNLKIDNIYNNLPNTNRYGSASSIPANISLKAGDIIPKQSDYQVAVDFFNLKGITLPLCFAEILEGDNSDINATQYGFCLRHLASGTDYSQRVIYEAGIDPSTYVNNLPKAPLDNNGLTDYTTIPYYYAVFTFNILLNMFNKALYVCWNAMITAHPADSPPCPPYFIYNEANGRISLILHHSYVRSPLAEVFWNSNTEKLIEGIRVEIQQSYYEGGQDDFKDFKLAPFIARPYGSPNSSFGLPQQADILNPPTLADVDYLPWKALTGANGFYIMTQEYDCLYFWNNIKSIVFFSSNISTKNQYLPITNNPNLINSRRVSNMTIASPSVVTSVGNHNFAEGQTVYIAQGSYSVGGVPVTVTTAYRARNVTVNTLELYTVDTNQPVNVTAYNPAVPMWVYGKLAGNIGLFSNPSRSIVSYFDIISQSGVDWRTNLYNLPNYRKWNDLTSDGKLDTIDLDIYLQLANGALIPFQIAINDSLGVKLVFRKK